MDVRESKIASTITIRQAFVVYPKQVKYRSLQVMNVNWVLDHLKAELIGPSVDTPALDPSASKKHRESMRVMVTPSPRQFGPTPNLNNGCTTKLGSNDHQRFV